jgi:hypothetical protein
MLVRRVEGLGVLSGHERIAREQAAEQEHFGNQEKPHPQLARIDLLLHLREVMLEKRAVDWSDGFTHAGTFLER